jgi:hypothetical protein
MKTEALEQGRRLFREKASEYFAKASEYFVAPVVILTALGLMIVAWSLVRVLAD